MATIARKWVCNTANSAQKRFHPRTLTGASDLQHGNNEITQCKSSAAFIRDASVSSNIDSSTSFDIRRNGRLCLHEVKRSFSSTPKPFSRKKPVKTTGDAETDKQGEFVPTLSFNYRATLAILEIARAVSPVISMNEGFTLTSNFDLRIDGGCITDWPIDWLLNWKFESYCKEQLKFSYHPYCNVNSSLPFCLNRSLQLSFGENPRAAGAQHAG